MIINAAAHTAVDAAETQEAEAHAINAIAPGVLAEEAKKIGAAVVHYSTDYVFDGSKTTPYEEPDSPGPINVYGKTKLAGEQAVRASGVPHLILRTAWVYAPRGRDFLLTILRLATEKEELRVLRDQFGAPTCSRDIALTTVKILAQLISHNSSAANALSPVTRASRPHYSVLSNSRLKQTFGLGLLDWRTQLRHIFEIECAASYPSLTPDLSDAQ